MALDQGPRRAAHCQLGLVGMLSGPAWGTLVVTLVLQGWMVLTRDRCQKWG